MYIFLFDPPPGGGEKNEVLRGWGKKMITSLSKKRKREGKSGKRERKRRKKEKGKGKRKKGKEKEGRDVFLLTQDNKPNLFGEKKTYFFPRGKEYYIFLRCECIYNRSKM